jgi:L-ribulokinase
MPKYTIGLDYGTNSVRALLVDTQDGREVATAVFNYPSGNAGVIEDSRDPNLARQNPADYILGAYETIRTVLAESKVNPDEIVGLGVDTTGSSPMPIDKNGTPLSELPEFAGNPNAMCWLWKDHTGHAEAAEITAKAADYPYLAKCGGTYSSEWFWSKILRCARVAPEVFAAADRWIEIADWIPAFLAGTTANPVIGICAAGHKAMYHSDWGGLPSAEFLATLDPRLPALRERLYTEAVSAIHPAGTLSATAARETGLNEGIPISVGAFDAHFGAVGSGIRPGTLVKIMGTSTCDIMVHPLDQALADVPGLCGIVPESVLPGMYGLEAGQSAVGDIFNWFVRLTGRSHEALTTEALALKPGQSGLLALDWNNGNRTILVDPLLTGLLVGQTLHTSPAEIYRALIEATAYGARRIIERLEEYGVEVREVVNCGGIAEKSALTMQIYADVINKPMKVSRSPQTCALGSAVFASVVGGAHPDVATAVAAMTGVKDTVYEPESGSVATYERLYQLYKQLHDTFGNTGQTGSLTNVMKDLIEIRNLAA